MIRLLVLIGSFVLLQCQPAAEENGKNQTSGSPIKKASDIPQIDTSRFNLDYVMGKFDPSNHPDFVVIATKYADRKGLYLRKETYEAFKKMHAAALEEGVKLVIRSATRNFNYQKGIWERKWTGQRLVEGKKLPEVLPMPKERALKILEQSSMPSTSRHHWGTDIDLNNFNNAYFEKGKGLQLYEWLKIHASEYGFCQVYSEKGDKRPSGYNEEKWHWSYLPVAKEIMTVAKVYLNDGYIKGFKGAEAAISIGVVDKYVLGINPECQ